MEIRQEIVLHMRELGKQGLTASQILKQTLPLLSEEERHPIYWTRYFSEAFCLEEGEAHTLFGWSPDEDHYLDDEKLDALMEPKLEHSKNRWASERSQLV